ncbi:ATP-binding protein [Sphingobium sp. JS3065]|uniref:hybrid sensor histidine kinase/response regulator n=1 Tax=Sphingobium sp. JS3065 TaxID=2970925 RepID=UPI002263B884|nr:ATP-binding protein [Sphingobium sp. JS3065]UZW57430.1 ATP-binding protein [Sphingobium sp. JS3065]
MIPHLSERTLILAPLGRDADIAASILKEAGLRTEICTMVDRLVQGMEQGAGFALVTEESLLTANLNPLSAWLRNQPEWSDFPFVLLTKRGGGLERNPAASRFLDMLGNVTFLERPFHPTTLISLAQSALRGRRRQYEARARLEELQEGAARYRSLFDSIEAGFCVIEMIFDEQDRPVDYRFVETNPAFVRQTGLADAVGRTMKSLVPGHEEHWFTIYGKVAKTGESVRFENGAEALGGYWYDVHAFRVGDAGFRRVAVLFNDISERRRMEAALRASEDRLRRLNETLEERVAERSRELEHAQQALRQSQKLESMGQLTGGVAHDFNNLLTPILGSLDLLSRRGVGTERERRLIDGALQSADRAKTLVQRLLAFARRQPLKAAAVDLAHLVREMTDLIGSTVGPRIQVQLTIEDGLPLAEADGNQIEMALLNLAVNARDAMPDGGTLSIDLDRRTVTEGNDLGLAAADYIRLRVSDTGIGMNDETITKAIEPFFTTKGIGRGTGLGLSMVHGLVAQLGGALSIDSMVGKGTRVSLWLPVSERPRTVATPHIRLHHSQPEHRQVLVVDDEELVRASTADMLREMGYDVMEANSAEKALLLLAEGVHVDVLVTDHLMPGLTGTDLAERVKKMKPDMQILVISGYAEGKGISTDFPHLTKPFKQDDLAASLAFI